MTQVIVGTYEKLILGYELQQECDNKWKFKLVFTNNSHLAPVRCLAVSATRGILASAGSDESIRLLDLKKRVELGTLPYHSGSINALSFYKSSHLFSCSDDGKMVVWRRRDWRMLKAFRRHKGSSVKGVAIHPTGCLALTVGDDKTLRTWDLVAGKNAFSINLKQPAQSVKWSPVGTYFAVIFDAFIDVYSTAFGRIVATFPEKKSAKAMVAPAKKITSFAFIDEENVLFGTESGCLFRRNISELGEKDIEAQAHKLRVKGITLLSLSAEGVALFLTASSDGELTLWQHNIQKKESGFERLAVQKTDFRILSLALWTPTSFNSNETSKHLLEVVGEEDGESVSFDEQQSRKKTEKRKQTSVPMKKKTKKSRKTK